MNARSLEHGHPSASESPLEQLLAAILATDASASVVERSPERASVTISEPGAGQAVAVLLQSSAALESEVLAIVASVKAQQRLHLVIVDEQGLDLAPRLKRLVPSMLLQVRGARSAHLWVPGEKLKTIRGLGSSVLSKASQQVGSGAVASLKVVAAAREEQGEEAVRFLKRLSGRRPVVTWTIALLSSILFGLQLLWGGGDSLLAQAGRSEPLCRRSMSAWRGAPRGPAAVALKAMNSEQPTPHLRPAPERARGLHGEPRAALRPGGSRPAGGVERGERRPLSRARSGKALAPNRPRSAGAARGASGEVLLDTIREISGLDGSTRATTFERLERGLRLSREQNPGKVSALASQLERELGAALSTDS